MSVELGTNNKVFDEAFFGQLRRCRKLRDALLRSEDELTSEERDACQLGDLNLLVEVLFAKGVWRQPTADEWHRVEWRVQTLWDALGPVARKKFVLGETSLVFTGLCIGSGVLAILSLALNVLPLIHFPFVYTYLMWLIALGAMGSVAFIGMNALSIQDDATFDLTNGRLVSLRIMLGALFGVVLSISFSYDAFRQLIEQLGDQLPRTRETADLVKQTMYILLPFILGFSTPLVIAVLNKFVDAIQSFFGLGASKSDGRESSSADDRKKAKLALPSKPAIADVRVMQPVRSGELPVDGQKSASTGRTVPNIVSAEKSLTP